MQGVDAESWQWRQAFGRCHVLLFLMGSSNLKTAFSVSRSRGELSLLWQSGPVLTAPEEFVNAALFLRLGLPSTLIHHENEALFLQLGLPSTLIRHENAALFLRLGLPSTLIRHENGDFRKRSSNRRNLKTLALRFRVEGCFRKQWLHDNHVMSVTEFSSNKKSKWPVIIAFWNSFGVVWTVTLMRCRVKTNRFKFPRHRVDGFWKLRLTPGFISKGNYWSHCHIST